MCRNRYHRKQKTPKEKFYSHFRTYLIVNAVFIGLNLLDGDPFDWIPLAFMWGIGLGIHYLNVYGLKAPDEDIFEQLKKGGSPQHRNQTPDKPVTPDPKWREKDLV